jgi:hypothetical protein
MYPQPALGRPPAAGLAPAGPTGRYLRTACQLEEEGTDMLLRSSDPYAKFHRALLARLPADGHASMAARRPADSRQAGFRAAVHPQMHGGATPLDGRSGADPKTTL